jgi:uncharacterized membrane protein
MSNFSAIGSLSIVQSLSRGWDSIKANIWLFGGFAVIYFLLSMILGFIPVVGQFVNLCSFIFSASIFSALNVFDTKRKLDFNDFFLWSPKFLRLFVGNLLLIALFIFIMIPFAFILIAILGVGFFTELMKGPEVFEGLFVGSTILILILAVILFIIILSIALFAYQYIIQFTELSYFDALKYSFKIGRNNIGQVVIFAFVALFLMILGGLLLGMGLFFTIPLIVATQYYFLQDMISDKSPIEHPINLSEQFIE